MCAIRFATMLVLSLVCAAAVAQGPLLFENSDFEAGDLTNWRTEGTAFEFQPTLGNNPLVREKPKTSLHQGKYWAGSHEKFQGKPGQKAGGTQGDKPVGGLISTGFDITSPYISFLIGGGESADVGVQLIVEGDVVHTATGAHSETMRRVYWDVRDHLGKKAYVYIIDKGAGAWGHINADDFRYADEAPDTLLFPNSDFEMGDLGNWTAEGDAFAAQPTKGDNEAARTDGQKKAGPQGEWWVSTFEKFQGKEGQTPGDRQGEAPKGKLTSIPFTIRGKVITFLVGGSDAAPTGVSLIVDGRETRTMQGRDSHLLGRRVWDVEEFIGKEATITISDQADSAWGFVSADDFRYGQL